MGKREKRKYGKAQKLSRCCREIRLMGGRMVLGGVYDGFNTLSGEYEKWVCIKVAKDYNDNILQRIKEVSDE